MRSLTKMLVVVDTRKDVNIALNRARLLAKATGGELHVLAPNPRGNSESLDRLEAIAAPLREEGVKVTAHEIWQNGVTETIIHVRQLERCDLVIKETRKQNKLAAAVFTPDDWSLLRQCRVPVLLVNHDNSWMNGRILAAIDAAPEDGEHQVLNKVILEHAAAISGIADAECHVATAHPGPMLSSSDPAQQSADVISSQYQDTCQPLIDRYAIAKEMLHIEEGPAETLIPDLAKRLDISLVVMGSVARTGLKGALLGNTAEQILGSIETDVLILRPRDIMDPLEQTISG